MSSYCLDDTDKKSFLAKHNSDAVPDKILAYLRLNLLVQ